MAPICLKTHFAPLKRCSTHQGVVPLYHHTPLGTYCLAEQEVPIQIYDYNRYMVLDDLFKQQYSRVLSLHEWQPRVEIVLYKNASSLRGPSLVQAYHCARVTFYFYSKRCKIHIHVICFCSNN